jgi:RNA polymerase sigma-70 factor (ECF subfamily)
MVREVQTVHVEPGLARLYREEGARLWRAVFTYAGNRDVASDAVAEAFAQYARRGDEVRLPAAWVWQAAFRIAAGELKRRSEHVPMPRDLAYEMPEPAPIFEALAKLSPRQRACVVLRHHAGYSGVEIGGILGLSPATVRVHLLQARRRLSVLLEVSDED